MTLLRTEHISMIFGGVTALSDVSMTVAQGELLGLIGPNGAGKTTLLRVLTGILHPSGGRVFFKGADITRLPTYSRAQRGIALTHQIVRPFREMTLIENVMLAAEPAITASPLRSLMHVGDADARTRAHALLKRLGIDDAAERKAGILPLGYLKRMQVARALAFSPELLLLDEPLAGLNYSEAARMADTIAELNREGRTILLVEHNLGEVTRIAKRILVLNNGAVLAEGAPDEVMRRADVRTAYLGEADEGAPPEAAHA
jgi:branched-chain amino acid transport system ATP-binding protein